MLLLHCTHVQVGFKGLQWLKFSDPANTTDYMTGCRAAATVSTLLELDGYAVAIHCLLFAWRSAQAWPLPSWLLVRHPAVPARCNFVQLARTTSRTTVRHPKVMGLYG